MMARVNDRRAESGSIRRTVTQDYVAFISHALNKTPLQDAESADCRFSRRSEERFKLVRSCLQSSKSGSLRENAVFEAKPVNEAAGNWKRQDYQCAWTA
jgi:hypothetical protein